MALKHFFRLTAVATALLLSPSLALGAEPPSSPAATAPPTDPPPRRFTRGRAIAYGLTSGAFALGSIPAGLLGRPYSYAMQFSAYAPLWGLSPSDAYPIAGLHVGFLSTAAALRMAKPNDEETRPYRISAELLGLHQSMYAAYATYRMARENGSSPAWNDQWRPWSAGEMLVAPFAPKNLTRPIVFIPLLAQAGLAGLGLVGAVAQPFHGGRFARDMALGAALSWDAGVTEEAFFRGFVYEELKLSLGRWPARAIDSAAFALIHVPGDVGSGLSADKVVLGAGVRAVWSLLFEMAYDEGGLPASVALHVLTDLLIFTASALRDDDGLLHPKNVVTPVVQSGPPGAPPVTPFFTLSL